MIRSVRSRAFAILVSAAVAVGTLTVASPAAADDDPSIPSVSAPSDAPQTEPGEPDPSESPEAEPSEAPEPEPTATPEPSDAPEEDAPDAAGAESVTYTGRVVRLSEQDLQEVVEQDVQIFRVAGKGLLRIDVSGLDLKSAILDQQTLRLAVPAGLELSDDPEERFSQLATASAETPLVALDAVAATGRLRSMSGATADLVNQTPATSATHQVFAVLVTPSNGPSTASANQTAAKVQTAVAHADSYWSQQSGGAVHFQLQGTVPWYKSTHPCTTQEDTFAIFNEASNLAASQFGFEGANNQHVVLFFPNGDDLLCGGAAGRGTIGTSVNDGGVSWVIGTDAPVEQAALAHELGHNLSLGHANWLECASADPHPGFLADEGCSAHPYGDLVDTMGFGVEGFDGGALSSPGAIRSGLWTSSAYSVAHKGTSSYTLNAVSSNSGKRAVVVEDKDGVNYFVEFRNFTDEDAQYAGFGCDEDACVSSAPGVRVLRLEQQVFLDQYDNPVFAFKGYAGDDSLLVGRTVGGADKVSYQAGESFNSQASGQNGITVKVDSISATSAKVTITKRDESVRGSYVVVDVIDAYDAPNLHVGDVITALMFADWTAGGYKFQWYRGTASTLTAISGATKQNYTVSGSDLGKYLLVVVTGSTSGAGSQSAVDPNPWESLGYGPVLQGVIDTGSVTIDASTYPFKAVLKGWTTPGVTYSYKWWRDGSVISGATSASYTPTAADRGADLKVHVDATKSGYASQGMFSAAADYTLDATGTLAISGTAKIGQTLSLNALSYTKQQPAPGTPVASPVLAYQWFRSGTAISGATNSSYTLGSSDYGKTITATVTASTPGTMRHVATATLAGTIAKGTIAGSLAAPVISTDNSNPAALKLTASLPAGSVAEAGVTLAYQWYRGTTAISGAKSSSYTLGSSDYGKSLFVRATLTKPNYDTVVRDSVAKNYSIVATGALEIGGVLKVGQVIEPSVLDYATASGPVGPSFSYQWYRSDAKISGATSEQYTLTSADYGKKLTVTVTARVPGYQPLAKTSAKTVAVGKGLLAGSLTAPTVTRAPDSLVLSSSLEPGAVIEPGVTTKIQWYRGSTAISGKTQSSYTLTAADHGKQISVKYSVSKSNFGTAVLASAPVNYSLQPAAAPWIMGVPRTGQVLTAVTPAYDSAFGPVSPALHYQWYAAGLAVGTDDYQYTPVAGDAGKKITVKVTPVVANLLSVPATSEATAAVASSELDDSGPLVVTKGSDSPPTLTVASTGVTTPGVTVAYQWFRGASPISKATASSYRLTTADNGYQVHVRVTISKPTFTTIVKESSDHNYDLSAGAGFSVSGDERVGGTIVAEYTEGTTDGDGLPADRDVTFQWYRGVTPIAGATSLTYSPVAADLGKVLELAATESVPGFLPISSSWFTGPIAKGVIAAAGDPVDVNKSPSMLLTATLPAITEPGVTKKYQWFRGGVAVTGKTGLTYQLGSADFGKAVSFTATITKGSYTTLALTTVPTDYSVTPSTPVPVIVGTVAVGETLALAPRDFTAGGSVVTESVFRQVQWLRNGAPIAGGDEATYIIDPADAGKAISVRVTATYDSFLTSTSTSSATQPVGALAIAGAGGVDVDKSGSLLLSVSSTGIDEPGVTDSYQWYRGTTAVSGKTAASYQLTTADSGKSVWVRVTTKKVGYTNRVQDSTPTNYSLQSASPLNISGSPKVGQVLNANELWFSTSDDPEVELVPTYAWYRSGVLIAGSAGSSYHLTSADLGKKITVKATATLAGYLGYSQTSAATAAVAKGDIAGSHDDPELMPGGPGEVAFDLSELSIVEDGTNWAFQWYRGSTAISGSAAKGPSYLLVAADAGKAISLRITVTKSGYNTVVLHSDEVYPTLLAAGVPQIGGTERVGQWLEAAAPDYTTYYGPIEPGEVEFQWLRNGAAIPGATDDEYQLVAADFGKTIAVRVTARLNGYFASTSTSFGTDPIARGVIAGTHASLGLDAPGDGSLLYAALPGSSITEPGVTITYQWIVNGVPQGEQSTTFGPWNWHSGETVQARAVVTKANYTTVVLLSPAWAWGT